MFSGGTSDGLGVESWNRLSSATSTELDLLQTTPNSAVGLHATYSSARLSILLYSSRMDMNRYALRSRNGRAICISESSGPHSMIHGRTGLKPAADRSKIWNAKRVGTELLARMRFALRVDVGPSASGDLGLA